MRILFSGIDPFQPDPIGSSGCERDGARITPFARCQLYGRRTLWLGAVLVSLCLSSLGLAGEPPSAHLSNDALSATVYLPDAETGFYRGPRFDWSGMVASLDFEGHRFFWETKPPPDPNATDNVIGTPGEFGMESPLGYDEVAAGGTFYKIGVGRLTRPDDKPYFFAHRFAVDPLPWTTKSGKTWVEFNQELPEENGWGYHLTKRIEMDAEKPVLTIRYTLKNTGSKPIRTDHYCHNFTVIDDLQPGPGTRMLLDFAPYDTSGLKDIAVVKGDTIEFLAGIPRGKSLFRKFDNFKAGEGLSARIENDAAGAGLRITSDTAPHQVVFYGLGKTVSFEQYIPIALAPGETKTWSARYEPYLLKSKDND